MLFADVHDVEFLENLMGLGWLVQGRHRQVRLLV
jgi:hypothetical protein